jgi:superfamily II DNA or RNA helicase
MIRYSGPTVADDLAQIQSEGVCALYNTLVTQNHTVKTAYLADEVGMGKTYIALGVISIMRHFRPNMRVVVIAPSRHMQHKWIRDQRNFIKNNYQLNDLAVRNDNLMPVRPFHYCHNLIDFTHKVILEHDYDFILRMSSFSLATSSKEFNNDDDKPTSKKVYDKIIRAVLRSRQVPIKLWEEQPDMAKRLVGESINRLLRPIDLLIVDEAHNLKHGVAENAAYRNQVLHHVFSGRVEHLLLLSATPIESSYRELYNQLAVFGAESPYSIFNDDEAELTEQKSKAKELLIRRVYSLRTASDVSYTRNQYRREWRGGGLLVHDDTISVTRSEHRLIMGLMQLKVQEHLSKRRYPYSFQVGLLASFESYAETVTDKVFHEFGSERRAKRDNSENVDVSLVNGICERYYSIFKQEPPHPKMDALCKSLQDSWDSGQKALIFVRRIASATEIVNKLNESHDQWLLNRLKYHLPHCSSEIDEMYKDYQRVRSRITKDTRAQETRASQVGSAALPNESLDHDAAGQDIPDVEEEDWNISSFFSWLFRYSRSPLRRKKNTWRTGGWLRNHIVSKSSSLSTLFLFNDVADLLDCDPAEILAVTASITKKDVDSVSADVRHRLSAIFVHEVDRYTAFYLTQACVLQYIIENCNHTDFASKARALFDLKYSWYLKSQQNSAFMNHCYKDQEKRGHRLRVDNAFRMLREHTLWTRIRTSRHDVFIPILEVFSLSVDRQAVLRREIARELMTNALLRSHAAIDVYSVIMQFVKSLRITPADTIDGLRGQKIVDALVLHLGQRRQGLYRGIDELVDIAQQLQSIIDLNVHVNVNALDPLQSVRRNISSLFRNLSPSSDMTGGAPINLIRQFRMPGYPFNLVATDVISEGQDLHTFCDRVYHYGITWMPSAMEQRTGRIDRVNSKTERRLRKLTSELQPDEKLQVYIPYLQDTIEVVQVQRVLMRMNRFLEALHDDLVFNDRAEGDSISINTPSSILINIPPQLTQRLSSSFDINRRKLLNGVRRTLRVTTREIAKREKVLNDVLHEVSLHDAIIIRSCCYVSARRLLVIDHHQFSQNYQCHVSEHHGLLIVVCRSLAAVLPRSDAPKLMKLNLPDGVRILNGEHEDSNMFDCWVVGEIYVDANAKRETIRRVNGLVERVVCTAQVIDNLDGTDNDHQLFPIDESEKS